MQVIWTTDYSILTLASVYPTLHIKWTLQYQYFESFCVSLAKFGLSKFVRSNGGDKQKLIFIGTEDYIMFQNFTIRVAHKSIVKMYLAIIIKSN